MKSSLYYIIIVDHCVRPSYRDDNRVQFFFLKHLKVPLRKAEFEFRTGKMTLSLPVIHIIA